MNSKLSNFKFVTSGGPLGGFGFSKQFPGGTRIPTNISSKGRSVSWVSFSVSEFLITNAVACVAHF